MELQFCRVDEMKSLERSLELFSVPSLLECIHPVVNEDKLIGYFKQMMNLMQNVSSILMLFSRNRAI